MTRKLLSYTLVLCCVVLSGCSPDTQDKLKKLFKDLILPQEAQATTILGNPDPMSRSCATGYIRTTPNFCSVIATPGSAVSTILDNTCRNINWTTAYTPAIPVTATFGLFKVFASLRANNAIGERVSNLVLYYNSACTSTHSHWQFGIREFSAVAVNTYLNRQQFVTPAPLVNGVMYYSGNNASGGGTPEFIFVPLGYYD